MVNFVNNDKVLIFLIYPGNAGIKFRVLQSVVQNKILKFITGLTDHRVGICYRPAVEVWIR